MPVAVGDAKVSPEQRRLLARAARPPSIQALTSLFRRITLDEDLAEGSEQLHPEWVSLFDQNRSAFDRAKHIIGSRVVESIVRFFDDIRPIDPLVSTIDPKEEDIVFVLGAGASNPIPSGIPTVAGLLPELLNRARRLDREQLTALAEFCEQNNISDIEDLLTAVQVSAFCSRNPKVMSLLAFQIFGEESDDDWETVPPRGSTRADISSSCLHTRYLASPLRSSL